MKKTAGHCSFHYICIDLPPHQELGLDGGPRWRECHGPVRVQRQPVDVVRRRGRDPAQVGARARHEARRRHDLGPRSRRLPRPVRLRALPPASFHQPSASPIPRPRSAVQFRRELTFISSCCWDVKLLCRTMYPYMLPIQHITEIL